MSGCTKIRRKTITQDVKDIKLGGELNIWWTNGAAQRQKAKIRDKA